MKTWITQKMFLVSCVLTGRTLKEARWLWHSRCMEAATRRARGRGMGDYVAPLADGNRYPNRED